MKPSGPYLRFWKRFLFVIVSLGAYYFIIKRLIEFQHWSDLLHFSKPGWNTLFLFLLFISLWAANIISETKKWQILIRPFVKVNFKDALIQFFAGSFTAVGSPARLAEPGGRMALLDKKHRLNALMMTGIGGFAQNAVIGIVGLLSLYFSDFHLDWSVLGNHWWLWFIASLLVTVIMIIIFLSFQKKMHLWWSQLKKVDSQIILQSVFYTIIRFCIFNIQLVVLMKILYPNLEVAQLIQHTPIYFFIITLIPSFILADIGIRGSVALIVFGNMGISEPILLTVILLLWLFNVVIPALIGGWILHIKKGLIGSRS